MDEQDEYGQANAPRQDNAPRRIGHDDGNRQAGKKALMVDKDGFVKEIGEGTWRKYDPHDDG